MKLFNNNQLRIMDAFLSNIGRQLYMREIARMSGLDIKIVSRELKVLLDNNVMDYEIRGKIKLYHWKNTFETEALIIATEAYRSQKFLEKHEILELMDLNKITDFIIFGSYAKNLENKHSDIDIVIFSKKTDKIEKLLDDISKKIHKQYISFGEFTALYRKDTVLAREILRSHVLFGKHKEITQIILKWKELDGV
ncbi:MAG: nucleotidyltransferase domain-containing protein [Candidatus Woesearchaeota archaeon]